MRKTAVICFLLFLGFLQLNGQGKGIKTVVQKGHEAVVKAAIYSPDGQYLFTASRDQTVKMWEVVTQREVRDYVGHKSTVNDLRLSADGQLMATSSADRTAAIWDVKTGKMLFQTPEDEGYMTSVSLSADGKMLAAGGYDYQLKIWDVKSQELIKELPANPDKGLGLGIDLAFSPDSKQLAVGEDDRLLKVYEVATWDTLYTIPFKRGRCGGCATFVAYHPDGKLLVKAVNNGEVTLHDAANGQLVRQLSAEEEDIRSVTFNPKGDRVMVATEKSVMQWSVETGELLLQFEPDVKAVNGACYAPEGQEVTVAGNDEKATVWSAADGQKVSEYSGVLQEIDKGGINYDPDNYRQSYLAKYTKLKSRLLMTSDGKRLLKGKFGRWAKMWEISSGATAAVYRGHSQAVLCATLTKDDQFLATGDGKGDVILWDTQTGDSLRAFQKHRGPVWDVQFSHDQKKLVTVSWDGYAFIWQVETGELLKTLYFGDRSAFKVSFTPNDLYLVAALLDKKTEIFEIDTGRSIMELVGHADVVSEIVMIPKSNRALTTSWDGSARLWNLETGWMMAKYQAERPLHSAVVVAGKGKVLVAGADHQIKVLKQANLEYEETLTGHESAVVSLLVNQQEDMLVSHSLDGVTKIWDLDKKQEFFEHIHIGKSDWMVKSRQGYFNATEGARARIHFVRGNKTFGLNQFFNDFYRPDLIPDLFSVRGGGKSREGLLQKIDRFPPPTVKLALNPAADQLTSTVLIKSVDQGGGFSNVKLYHNGKRIMEDAVKAKTSEKREGEWYTRVSVPLVGGRNVFGAVAVSKGNTESALMEQQVFSKQKAPSAKCHVLAIGINDYQNNSLDLSYAKADAMAVAEMIQQDQQQLFQEVKVRTLFDTEATKENILATLDEMAEQVGINDLFLFYYAGHGSVVENQFFFIPTETPRLFDLKTLKKTALEASVLQGKLQTIKALKQVIIMDACQSGGSVELLAQRGSVQEKAIAQLSRSAGIHVLASAGSDQFASEFKTLGHGLFTHVLLKALGGAADGAPKEGKVTLFELKSYLDDQVPELSMEYKGKPQYPYTFSRGNDFPLSVQKEE